MVGDARTLGMQIDSQWLRTRDEGVQAQRRLVPSDQERRPDHLLQQDATVPPLAQPASQFRGFLSGLRHAWLKRRFSTKRCVEGGHECRGRDELYACPAVCGRLEQPHGARCYQLRKR